MPENSPAGSPFNADLSTQLTYLENTLQSSPTINYLLKSVPQLGLPNWYLGAGCVFQTVWNKLSGLDPSYGIKDADLVYFQPDDLSLETQEQHQESANSLLKDSPIPVDLVNEARVHLWYHQEFGREISPYTSSEDAISSWLVKAACIGVRSEEDGRLSVYAPYGLNDLFGMILRPNKGRVARVDYERKTEQWVKKWPRLTIIPWNEGD